MTRTCPLCSEPMTGEKPNAVFHVACGMERRRIIDRMDKRARYHGQEPERFCSVCLGPREKGKRMCEACAVTRRKEAGWRYESSPKGRAKQQRYTRSPKCKLVDAAWNERNPEKVRAAKQKYEAKKPRRTGTVLPCATLFCEGTFVRVRTNGRRIFCAECQVLFRTVTRRENIVRSNRARRGEKRVA